DAAQELAELGPRGTLFRVGWELRGRLGVGRSAGFPGARNNRISFQSGEWTYRLQLEDPIALGRALRDRIPIEQLEQLRAQADAAMTGRIQCFGRWTAEFGT